MKTNDYSHALYCMDEVEVLEAEEPETSLDSYDDEPELLPDYYDEPETLEIYDDEVNEYLARRNRYQFEAADEYEEEEYGWLNTDSTDEDTWWALTDGMYGECPRNPIAFDAALEALGF